jgi:hypothetical protein
MSKLLHYELTQSRDCPNNIAGDCALDDTIICSCDGHDLPDYCPLPEWIEKSKPK